MFSGCPWVFSGGRSVLPSTSLPPASFLWGLCMFSHADFLKGWWCSLCYGLAQEESLRMALPDFSEMCCFPSYSFLPFLCSVCSKFTVFSLILHFQSFLMGSGRAFCFDGGIGSTCCGLDMFWVVSTSTDRLLVQADFCQVYFKLSQISVLCQSDFSPALASDSQVFYFFRIPKCFHG